MFSVFISALALLEIRWVGSEQFAVDRTVEQIDI